MAADDAVYVAAALTTEPDSGFRISTGTPPEFRREVVWRCTGPNDCTRTPLDVYPGAGRREQLAVSPDGRVLVVRGDRNVLVDL